MDRATMAVFTGNANPQLAQSAASEDELRKAVALKNEGGYSFKVPEDRVASTTGEVAVGCRPEKVWITPPGEGPEGRTNIVPAKIVTSAFLGVSLEYHVETPTGQELIVLVQNNARTEAPHYEDGADVELSWEPAHTFVVAVGANV